MEQQIINKLKDNFKYYIDDYIMQNEYLYNSEINVEENRISFIIKNIEWKGNEELSELNLNEIIDNRSDYNFKLEGYVLIEGNFQYTNKITSERHNLEKKIELLYIGYINTKRDVIGVDLYDKELENIKRYNDQLFLIYTNNNLTCLSSHDFRINEMKPYSFFSKHTNGFQSIRNNIDEYSLYEECINTSKDIKFYLGSTILYKRYINTNIFTLHYLNGEKNYTYNSSIWKRRYYQNINILFQKVYNYWDKIGDLLDFYIETNLNPKAVDFARVIDALIRTNIEKNIPELDWLVDFKEKKYRELNQKRKEIVHYTHLETQILKEFRMNSKDPNRINSEIQGYVDYFKEHLALSLIGFEKAILTIEKIKAGNIA